MNQNEKVLPYTMNALNLGLSNKAGDSEFVGLSQKVMKEDGSIEAFEDAPKDGKCYCRKDGAWVEIPTAPAE